MKNLAALALALLYACDDTGPAVRAEPAYDAGQVEQPAERDAAQAPMDRPAPDAGTAEPDSAVEPLPDAAAHDAGAVADAGHADAARVVPMVTHFQVDEVVIEPLCVGCHNPITGGAFGGGESALPVLWSVELVANATSTCNGMPYVAPGHPEMSYLLATFTSESPCEHHAPVEGFGKVEMQLLSDWISGGAR